MRHVLFAAVLAVSTIGCRDGTHGPHIQAPLSSLEAASAVPSENAIVNFHTVAPGLFRSGDVEPGDMPTLVDLGVKTILSLEDDGDPEAAKIERNAANAAGIEYIWQPLSGSASPTLERIDQALAVLSDASKGPVLVHCKHGADRTGIVVGAYRIRYEHWTVAHAVAEMRALGHAKALYSWDSVLNQVQTDAGG